MMRSVVTSSVAMSIFLASVFVASAPSARAALVWDNATPLGNDDGVLFSAFRHADDFVLSAPATLSVARFWGFFEVGQTEVSPINGSVGWAIHADAGGLPGAILFSGADASVAATPEPSIPNLGIQFYYFDVDLSPAVALGAGTYWLQLRQGEIDAPVQGAQLAWSYRSLIQESPSAVSDIDGAPVWNNRGTDLVYQLLSADEAIAIPEPSTLLLLSIGAVGAIWRKRRLMYSSRSA